MKKEIDTFYINKDSLEETSDEGAERYRADVQAEFDRRGIKMDVEWGLANPSTLDWLEEIAQEIWDDNLGDYG
jgi:hypothetical protein